MVITVVFAVVVVVALVVDFAVVEVTALGASYLAGLKVGYWKDIEDIRNNKVIERVFTPSTDLEKRKSRI